MHVKDDELWGMFYHLLDGYISFSLNFTRYDIDAPPIINSDRQAIYMTKHIQALVFSFLHLLD